MPVRIPGHGLRFSVKPPSQLVVPTGEELLTSDVQSLETPWLGRRRVFNGDLAEPARCNIEV